MGGGTLAPVVAPTGMGESSGVANAIFGVTEMYNDATEQTYESQPDPNAVASAFPFTRR